MLPVSRAIRKLTKTVFAPIPAAYTVGEGGSALYHGSAAYDRGNYAKSNESREKSGNGADRIAAWMRRYAVGANLPLLGFCAAMLISGALCGVLGCAVFGDRLDPERFRVSFLAQRAFSGYTDGVSYLREFVEWFFFYEKRFLLLLLFAFCFYAKELVGAYLVAEGFVLGYASVMLTRCGFSVLYLLFLFGMASFSFLLVLFGQKAIRFSIDAKARLENGKTLFFCEGLVPLLGTFTVDSAAVCFGLLLGSAICDAV